MVLFDQTYDGSLKFKLLRVYPSIKLFPAASYNDSKQKKETAEKQDLTTFFCN